MVLLLIWEIFKIPTLKIATLGTGYNTITTVEAAIEEKSEEYDEICCFDKDFNQAFEYWFILHLLIDIIVSMMEMVLKS